MSLVGETLGQFQIVEEAGRGGMAVVYKAYQPALQRYVAIKALSPKLTDDVDLVKRFLREAQSAAALHHPNVIVIHDVGSEGDTHYIVAEYLEGVTLAQLLREGGALGPERVLHILDQVASALDYAHRRGMIHRDIKPSNIMVDPQRDDHVTLMDFGLVQVAGGSRLTRTGLIMGTPDYMSPEQAKGEVIDQRTDIYSLGVTAYHMLTGSVPFEKSTPHAILLAHITEEPPLLSMPDREVSPQIDAVVRKALAKDPAFRYEWASDMVSDLRRAFEEPASIHLPALSEPAYAPPSPRTTQISRTPPSGVPAYGPTPPPGAAAYGQASHREVTPHLPLTPPPVSAGPTVKRRKWLWPAVGLGSLALLVVLVILAIWLVPPLLRLAGLGATPTLAVPTPSYTPAVAVQRFEVYPREIVQGERVTIEWEVSGAETVSIRPGVQEGAGRSGRLEHAPSETTIYELVLPDGQVERRQVSVLLPTATATQVPAATATNTPLPVATPTAVPSTPTPLPTATQTPEPPTDTPIAAATSTAAPTSTPAPPTSTPVPPTPASAPPSSGVLISFEQWGVWKRGDQPYGELTQSDEQVKSGRYAAQLRYDFPQTDQDFVVFANRMAIGGTPNVISAWVYGDGSGHLINVWVQDAQDEVWSVHLGSVGAAGWQEIKGAIDPSRPWPSGRVFGPDNGAIDYPIRFYGIVLDRPGTGPQSGQIYVDDIAVDQTTEVVPEPGPAEGTGGTTPGTGQIGRIVFTVQTGGSYALYSVDLNWDRMVKIGDTTWEHSTCAEGNVATTVDGITVKLRGLDRCPVAGTVDSCTSPNGQYKVNTNRQGSGYAVTLWRVSDNKMLEAVYVGSLNIHPGINWAPDNSHFLFTVHNTVYRADVGQAGYNAIIPFKDDVWPAQYTPDGAYVYYPKPVAGEIADIFAVKPDGSGERNLTHSTVSNKMCPRWRE